ncbi:hypothetical protein [Haladaptatus sp. DJG-WS-42]|uniref:hypothetical protein n=1 Tax=Haladaptatus sp. DJG-WS-42 TaxID=3120516 RepID=UPI0030D5FD03
MNRLAAHNAKARALRLGKLLFGDLRGLLVFIVALWVFVLYWRIGIFISDTFTVANAFVAVSEGHLWLDRFPYGPGPNTPGMVIVDGKLYGRNYGQIFLALPFLWAFQAIAVVADPRVALVAGWSGLTLAGWVVAGRLANRTTEFTVAGSVLALCLFAANLTFATPLDPFWTHQAALQVASMVAAAFVGVVLYRLLTEIHGHRVGLITGLFAVLATPVGFWASIPKRHALTTLFAVCTLYCFYKSRDGNLKLRALAYVFVGLTAWIHAPEAFVLIVALAVVDIPTAKSNDRRTLAALGIAFAISLLPFFITNALISGNPIQPPRLLPQYDGGPIPDAPAPSGEGGLGGGGESGGSGGSGESVSQSPSFVRLVLKTVAALGSSAVGKITIFTTLFTDGLSVAVHSPERLFQTYIRQGYYVRGVANDGNEAINLSILESAPILGALTAFPVYAVHRFREKTRVSAWLSTPVGATDAFALVYCALLTAVYLPRLPLYATITVRYLLPVFPFLLYAVMRLPSIRRVVAHELQTLAWAYAGTVLVGGQVLVLALLVQRPALGEAVQLHALLGIAVGGAFGLWTIASIHWSRVDNLGAALLGIVAGTGTLFLLLSGIEYFAYAGDFALPVSQRISELLPLLAG